MGIETLKKDVKNALEAFLIIQNTHAQSADAMHKIDRTLRLDYDRLGDEDDQYQIYLRGAEQEKNEREKVQIAERIAAIMQERRAIREKYKETYHQPALARQKEMDDATRHLQDAIDKLRAAEDKEVGRLISKNSDVSEQERLEQEALGLQETANKNEQARLRVQHKLSELLQQTTDNLNIKDEAGQKIEREALRSELQVIARRGNSELKYSQETKELAYKLEALIVEIEKLEQEISKIHTAREENSLFWFFYPLLSLFLGYARDEARQKKLVQQKDTAQVMELFNQAYELMEEQRDIRTKEYELKQQLRQAQVTINREERALLDIRRDFHAYCEDIDTLDTLEQPISGSIPLDKAITASQNLMVDIARDLKDDPEQGFVKAGARIEEKVMEGGTKVIEMVTGLLNRWGLYSSESTEDEPEQEALLSNDKSEQTSYAATSFFEGSPQTPLPVQYVAKALRVFLGEPSTINLELLIYCMEQNATYSIHAPQSFQDLLDQTITIYPELGARIIAMGDDNIPFHDRGLR
jgi:hypothetical protein